jgi:uncharacterized protein (TIGR00369 family)
MKAGVSLPQPRPQLWPLREPSTASVTRDRDRHRAHVRIEHAPLSGVTAAMLRWWYGNVPGSMTYAGAIYPRYLVWHPLDHISYEVVSAGGTASDHAGDDRVRTGSKLRIREALQRDPDQLIDIRVTVDELRPNRAVIVKRVLGTTIVRLENDVHDAPSGAAYRTTLTVGDTTPLARIVLNRIAHRRAFRRSGSSPGSLTTSRRSATSDTSCPTCTPRQCAERSHHGGSMQQPSLEEAQQVLRSQPFSALLGATLTQFDEDGAALEVDLRPEHRQQHGYAHGGVICYLADNALTFAAGPALGPAVLTSAVNLTYLRPAQGSKLVAHATMQGHTSRTAVTSVKIFASTDGNEYLCAVGSGTVTALSG